MKKGWSPPAFYLTQNDFQYEVLTLKPYTIHKEIPIRSSCLTTTLPNRSAKVSINLKLQRYFKLKFQLFLSHFIKENNTSIHPLYQIIFQPKQRYFYFESKSSEHNE